MRMRAFSVPPQEVRQIMAATVIITIIYTGIRFLMFQVDITLNSFRFIYYLKKITTYFLIVITHLCWYLLMTIGHAYCADL